MAYAGSYRVRATFDHPIASYSHSHQLYRQNPQCEGEHRNRRLFSTETAPDSRLARSIGLSFSLVVRDPTGQLEIAVAPAIRGAQFPARDTNEHRTSLCIEFGPGLDEVFERLKEVCSSDNLTTHFKSTQDSDYGLQLTDPDLGISVVDGTAVFEDLAGIGPGSSTTSRFKRLPLTSKPDFDTLYPIICAISSWFYHLRRRPATSALTQTGKVSIEFLELAKTNNYDETLMPKLAPSGDDLIVQDTKAGHVVELVVDEDKLYGQMIKNSSQHALYPYLMYFDNSDFSISKKLPLTMHSEIGSSVH